MDPSVSGSEQFFPTIYRHESGWMKVFNTAQAEGRIGLDFEFSPKTHKPTVIGIASREMCAAIPCTDALIQLVAGCPAKLVGHSVLGGHADRYVVAKAGFPTPIEKWDDSLIRHYICNQDFCAAPGKDEDADDQGALGLMNLWTAAAMATMLPQWKECRGSACSGPCPRHDVLGYCAVDAWAGLAVADECTRLMRARGIPEQLYADLARLTEMCGDMQAKGVRIDKSAVREMEGKMKEHKKVLFPFEKVKGKKRYGSYAPAGDNLLPAFVPGSFNPNAPADYLAYFKSHGITIKGKGNKAAGDKAAVIKALDKALRPLGLEYDSRNNVIKGDGPAQLPEVVNELYKLAQYKGAGKGLKSWFDDKYFDSDGFIHPRFIVAATSTGRLASSSPNFQNIPARGFGSDVRRVIVPRSDDLCIVKADFSQLELRMCVVAGTKILKTDLTWTNAEDVKVGDELLAFDEQQNQSRQGAKYRRSKVTACGSYKAKTLRIVTDQGTLTGSLDHRVVTSDKWRSRRWKQLADLRVGDTLPFTSQPWETDTTKEAGYLAGVFDGEGWVHPAGVGFAQNEGEVLEYTKKLVKARGLTFNGWLGKADHKGHEKDGRKRNKDNYKHVTSGGIWGSLKFLGEVRPLRLLTDAPKLWEGKRTWGHYSTKMATVLAIEDAGEQEVFAITTDTHTYIANGFLSHNCLWYAGWVTGNYENPSEDAFTWLVEQSGGRFENAAAQYGGKPRDIAKSVSHASDYGESFTVLTLDEIRTARRQAELKTGALLLFDGVYGPEWKYAGGYVAYTGANLAERLFKDKSYEARKKALAIQEIYFHRFPQIREWHHWITRQIDEKGYIQSHTGRYLELYGSAEDNFKLAAAFLGQGGGADYAQEKMLLFYDANEIPIMQVHDEFVFELPAAWSDEQCLNFMRPMVGESRKFPGFKCPAEVSRGLNWQKQSETNPNGLRSLGKIS